jgi:hypothetical protein
MKSVQHAQRTFDLAKSKQPPRGAEGQLEFGFSLMQRLPIPRLRSLTRSMAMPQEPPPRRQRELIPLDSLAKRSCPPGGDARCPQLEALAVDPEEDVAQIARADPAWSFPHPYS